MPRLVRAMELVVLIYFLEAGAFLVVSPWSRFWAEKVVSRSPASLRSTLHSPQFRGFLFGLGLLHIGFALREFEAWRRRDDAERAAAPAEGPSPP